MTPLAFLMILTWSLGILCNCCCSMFGTWTTPSGSLFRNAVGISMLYPELKALFPRMRRSSRIKCTARKRFKFDEHLHCYQPTIRVSRCCPFCSSCRRLSWSTAKNVLHDSGRSRVVVGPLTPMHQSILMRGATPEILRAAGSLCSGRYSEF